MMMSIYPAMALDSRHLTRTHTTINQKQAATLDDSKERWCDHGEVKVRRLISWKGYANCNFIYFAMALDGHSTRTHTTTNQKQAAIMEGRRERWCGHRGGENGEVKVFFIHSPCRGRGEQYDDEYVSCNGIRQPPFDEDTHNNQPKTGGDIG